MMRQAISPRLAMSSFRIIGTSHPEHAEARLLDRGVECSGEAEGQNLPCPGGMNDAIVPESRGSIERVALLLEPVENRLLEAGLLICTPPLSSALTRLAPHAPQSAVPPRPAQHGDTAARP